MTLYVQMNRLLLLFSQSIKWIWILVVFDALSTYGQKFPVTQFTLQNGLPSQSIRCIFKDSRGLMWIGTDNGMCTFDGKEFVIFSENEGMTAGSIWSITEDADGNIWAGSHGNGLFKFNGKRFSRFDKASGLISEWVRVVYYSSRFDCLMIGTERGLSILKNGRFLSLADGSIQASDIHVITGFQEHNQYIYITGYCQQTKKYYPHTNKVENRQPNDPKEPGYSCAPPCGLNGDTLWGNERNGVFIQHNKNKGNMSYTDMGQVFSMTNDGRNVWITAWSYDNEYPSGLFCYDGDTLRNVSRDYGISDPHTWVVFYDSQQQLLWVGTLNNGLYLIKPRLFTHWVPYHKPVIPMNVNDLYQQPGGNLWITTKDNIYLKTPQGSYRIMTEKAKGSFSKHLEQLKAKGQKIPPQFKSYLSDGIAGFNKIFPDHHGNTYINSNIGTFQFSSLPSKVNYYSTYTRMNCAFLKGDTLVMGGWNGFAVCPDIRQFNTNAIESKNLQGEIPSGNINTIIKEGDYAWIGTDDKGIYRLQGTKGKHFPEFARLVQQSVSCLTVDHAGHLIAGTSNGKIVICDIIKDSMNILITLSAKDGLRGNSIFWLKEDDNNTLWIGTNQALNSIPLDALYKDDSLVINFFDQEEGYLLPGSLTGESDGKGNLWIGGQSGLMSMSLKQTRLHPSVVAKVVLTGIILNNYNVFNRFGRDSSGMRVSESYSFVIRHRDNDITFWFDLYNYLNPAKDRFRFFLIGYDRQWSSWGQVRKATFTNLPPGRYKLLVEHKNLNKGECAVPLVVYFRVLPPWWLKWYWIAFFILLVSSALLFFIRRRILVVRKEERQKAEIFQRITELEISALQAQMNPHFIFNAINAIQLYILRNEVDEALTYLNDFSVVVRSSLENVNRKRITLQEELDFLKSFLTLEKMRFPDQFTWNFHVDPSIDPTQVLLPPMIVQPFVENAIRHGFPTDKSGNELEIAVSQIKEETLYIRITDNGIGRKAAGLRNAGQNRKDERPHSTQITLERVRLLNPAGQDHYSVKITDLTNHAGQTKGTKVDILLPIERVSVINT